MPVIPSKTEDIWREIVTILKNAQATGKRLQYVKEILEGVREDVPLFPCIILEPVSESESEYSVPMYKRIILQITITCWMEAYNIDTQITGEVKPGGRYDDNRGIFDIVADVKNELNTYPDLNGKAIKFNFANTRYYFETYPYRAGEITMNIEFITQKDTR